MSTAFRAIRGATFFRFESVPYPNVCQIWLRSDGRVEKGGGQTDTQRDAAALYIVDDTPR